MTADPWAAWRDMIEWTRDTLHVQDQHQPPWEWCPNLTCRLARAVAALLPVREAAEKVRAWYDRPNGELRVEGLQALDTALDAAARAVAEGGTDG